MDFELLKEKYLPVLKEHWLVIALGLVGISLIGYGLIQLLVTRGDSREITFQSGVKKVESEKKTSQKEVFVDVEGAVQKPGIHALPADSRIQDALIAAGGMSKDADRMKVSKGINLAAKVIDGGKIYIPFEGEVVGIVGAGESDPTILGTQTNGMVNINSGSPTELDTLPGIGPATADKIIAARPYTAVDELLSKKVVGKSLYEKIKEKVTIN